MGQLKRWIEADLDGLGLVLEGRDRLFAILELVSNSLDTNAHDISISLSKPDKGYSRLAVEDDDPDGFPDMKFAYTLFSDTPKRSDPTKAGRFTFGEKRVLSLCKEATIASTSGTVHFERVNGKENRRQTKKKRKAGTLFVGLIKMKNDEFEKACKDISTLIVRDGVAIKFNGTHLPHRQMVMNFEETLQTEVARVDGTKESRKMVRTERKTDIRLYEPLPSEKACLYELGIPVVETGDRWHVDVQQRIPLNMDRDNVTPAYLQRLRALVANHAHSLLSPDDAAAVWTRNATSSTEIDREAFSDIMTKRYGEKKVVTDPNDPESAKTAHANGYNPLYGRTLTPGEHENNRKFGVIQTSSSLFPTSRPYGNNPNAVAETVPESEWTPGMKNVREYTKALASELLHIDLAIVFVRTRNEFWACWNHTRSEMHFNVHNTGLKWFDSISTEVDALILHEFAHYYASDHLDEKYYEGICTLGAKLKKMALENPAFFAKYNGAPLECPAPVSAVP